MKTERKYKVELRNGQVLEVKVNPKPSKSSPEPFANDGEQMSILMAFRTYRRDRSVLDGCDMIHKNKDTCEREGRFHVVTVWSSGCKVDYLLCGKCTERMERYMTPLCNTGSE